MRLLIIFLFFPLLSLGQTRELSNSAQIHVVTCGPGQYELYSAFGHNAFRVVDPVRGMDYVYDYGVFDFDQPNFYLNFARGFLNYKVARRDYAPFLNFYAYYNRYVHEQQLNLSQEQKQKLFEYLEWNNQPENQYYSYDYFFDNCATKIRDVVLAALGDQVRFNDSHITEPKTIRQLTDDYLQYQPWGDLGIDICLGLPMDIDATPEIHLFLPEYVERGFNNATIEENGQSRPLVRQTFVSYSQQPEAFSVSLFTPIRVGWSLFFLTGLITFLGIKKSKWFKGIDIILFCVVGLLGLFLFLLWFATNHNAAAGNLNLLWALPFHLIVPFLILRKSKRLNIYFKLSFLWYLIICVSWFFLPQLLHASLFPIALSLLIRSWFIWKHRPHHA